jgi:aspartyl-tRNA(Asn)/glutamyl-tRNA(Gln) amidotransferase subunit B
MPAMEWETVIGLETHAQLSTQSKMFSGASTAFGAAPNAQASAVDIALPGVLPVANRGAVERAIRFGLAVGGTVRRRSVFARKNYFYPDLPKGYQISQFEAPIVEGGAITILVGGAERTVRLTRAHLEEDAGKLLHEIAGDAHSARSHGLTGVDFNRAGIPLLEIVTEPDMRSAEEAVAYARALHRLVRWIDICDGNMQEGSFRCDANVSVRRRGEPLGLRCEIKNLNSFRFLERAIVYEVRRQIEILEGGGKIVQETRLYDPDRDETRSMRTKEDAHDYRYFPDPDLLPLAVSEELIEEVRSKMPELPQAKRIRFQAEYGLPAQDTATLTSSRSMSEYFDRTVESVGGAASPKDVANWLTGDLSAKLNETGKDAAESAVSPAQLARLIALIHDGTISRKLAKEVFDAMWAGEGDPDAIIDKRGLRQMSDAGALEAIVAEVLAANPKQVEDYRAGKEKAFNSLVGQVMKATKGKANPAQVNEILKSRLAGG